ncbi:DUF4349 domain-containing protein [Streptomyces sp. HPF1205]|uniref:DUF4349 domain-containing protein n=1 Tax=Streptomyces sp. HPF1205 TaxID=2873262 RepID=UPI0027E16A3A|nr:DUF4349 domain-containing protein [Streptomyces sp. HPF1205]
MGGTGRRRGAAALGALLLAASLGVAGCGSGSGGSGASHADNAAAGPAARGAAPDLSGPNASGSNAYGPSGAPAGVPSATGTGTGTGSKAAAGGTPSARGQAQATYLARTANLTVRTPHVEDALDRARRLAASAGGYAGDEDTAVDDRGHVQSTVQLRVPPAAYDSLLTELAGLGTLLERKVSVEDVTGQVVDVTSRVKSQQASVARVRALMDRAGSLTDVVALESELSTREAALESMEAEQAALKSRVDLASVTLRLVEPAAKAAPAAPEREKDHGFWTTVGHALRDGWHAFCVVVRTVLVVLSVVAPFAAVAALVWWVYRLVRRRLPRTGAVPRAASSLRGPAGAGRGADADVPRVPAYPAYPAAPAAAPSGADTGTGAGTGTDANRTADGNASADREPPGA